MINLRGQFCIPVYLGIYSTFSVLEAHGTPLGVLEAHGTPLGVLGAW